MPCACSLGQCKSNKWRTISKRKAHEGFSNTEEEAVQLTKVVLLLEDELTKQSALL
jgi:hypothetical protein